MFCYNISNMVENKENTQCEFLRAELSLDKLRKVCEALDVKYDRDDGADELCSKLAIERPDLMRGRIWNIFRALLRFFDFTTDLLASPIIKIHLQGSATSGGLCIRKSHLNMMPLES